MILLTARKMLTKRKRTLALAQEAMKATKQKNTGQY